MLYTMRDIYDNICIYNHLFFKKSGSINQIVCAHLFVHAFKISDFWLNSSFEI